MIEFGQTDEIKYATYDDMIDITIRLIEVLWANKIYDRLEENNGVWRYGNKNRIDENGFQRKLLPVVISKICGTQN